MPGIFQSSSITWYGFSLASGSGTPREAASARARGVRRQAPRAAHRGQYLASPGVVVDDPHPAAVERRRVERRRHRRLGRQIEAQAEVEAAADAVHAFDLDL